MSRSISFAPNEFYHLYNRGTEKRVIFLDDSDHHRFLSLLYLANSPTAVDVKLQGRTLERAVEFKRDTTLINIGVYCLMPNHFHLLVQQKDNGGVSKFMQKILTAYTMYFNKKYERTGSLFQGKFKATHVDNDTYLKYLIAYIHLNPVKLTDSKWKENGIKDKASAENFLQGYPYSSFCDYTTTNIRPHRKIINNRTLPSYADNRSDFASLVTEWLDYNQEEES